MRQNHEEQNPEPLNLRQVLECGNGAHAVTTLWLPPARLEQPDESDFTDAKSVIRYALTAFQDAEGEIRGLRSSTTLPGSSTLRPDHGRNNKRFAVIPGEESIRVPIIGEFFSLRMQSQQRSECERITVGIDLVFREMCPRSFECFPNIFMHFYFPQVLFDLVARSSMTQAIRYVANVTMRRGLMSFENVADRFFYINIFPGLHRPNGRKCVPVIGRRNKDGVNRGIVQNRPQVLDVFGFTPVS